jgi:hypothetical protein
VNWNQPCCEACFAQRNPDRKPYRLLQENGPERCAWCGNATASGIYVRHDPADVPYPAADD